MIAIEDSPPGVTSARAAGIVTLGVPNIVPLATQDHDPQHVSAVPIVQSEA